MGGQPSVSHKPAVQPKKKQIIRSEVQPKKKQIIRSEVQPKKKQIIKEVQPIKPKDQLIKKPDNLSNCTCSSLKDEIAKLQTSQSQLKSMVISNKQTIKDMNATMPNNNMNNNNMNIHATKPNKQIISQEMSNHLPMYNGTLYAHSDAYICGTYNSKNDQLMHLNCSTGKQIKAFDNPFNCVTKAQGTRSEWTRPSLKLIDTHTPKHQNAGNVYKIVGC